MVLAADGAAAYYPGAWALAALVVILAIAVLVAKRERTRQQKVVDQLPSGTWSAPCLDATSPTVKRLLIVDEDGIAIAETKTGSRDSWPWSDVKGVGGREMRTRLQHNQGLRILLNNGHVRDLLVYLGVGKAGYERGAIEAQAEIERRLTAARGE
ncbi:hypothetical protein [Cumulibacter soli]|uniref:hypothetical protein n=1 Tax=Cumulibacter soli TaxID=2546344 RepID=UPI00106785AD|nr:hypothetical protein [Cumulibacter soli]